MTHRIFVCAAGCRVEAGTPDEDSIDSEDPRWRHLYCQHVPDGPLIDGNRGRYEAPDFEAASFEVCPCHLTRGGLLLIGDWFDEHRLAFEVEVSQ